MRVFVLVFVFIFVWLFLCTCIYFCEVILHSIIVRICQSDSVYISLFPIVHFMSIRHLSQHHFESIHLKKKSKKITGPDTVSDRQVVTVPDTVPDRRVRAAGRVHGYAATTVERAKESKYRETALRCALQVKGFSMETYGCLGPSAQAVIDAIVRAVSQKKECPYSPQEFRQLLRGSLQAALARGNALILQQAERRRLMRLMRSERQNG